MSIQTGRYFLAHVITSLHMASYATGYLMSAKEDSEAVCMEFLSQTQTRTYARVYAVGRAHVHLYNSGDLWANVCDAAYVLGYFIVGFKVFTSGKCLSSYS